MKIRIRTKLAAALAVPLIALVAVAGYQAVQASEEADEVRAETELATVAIGPSSLTTELQNERNYTALDLIGLADAATLEVASVAEARERVDTALDDLRTYLDGRGEIVSAAFAPAFESLDADLEDTRALWDDYEGEKNLDNQPLADEVFERFTVMTQAFFDATETVATEVDDNSLRNGSEIVDQSNRRGELLASITRTIVLDTLTDGGENAFRADAAAMFARKGAIEERIEQLSVGPYADVSSSTLGRDYDVRTDEIVTGYLQGEDVDITELLEQVSAGGAEDVTSSAEMATEILRDQAGQLTADADAREQQFLLLAVGVVVLAVLFSWLASRSITRPLRKLRAEAHEMATHRLPSALHQISETPLGEDVAVPELEPIEVKTRDEVREVVEVLNEVQDRTLELAMDQAVTRRNIADSFVNLGRRNQNLIDRQLEFITELERSETDPDELESLFRLDHLATRMRRNAESLLVLAGVETPRQYAAPVSVEDVVRASFGEVENYQRVTLRAVDDTAVLGEAASAVSHVIAELIENALQFSPPDSSVDVKGRRIDGGYVLAISDDGLGMTAEDLARANRRLSGEESYTVAPSRYLGHYVAGHLARRFGIDVRLQDSPAGGVTATVTLPLSLLAKPEDVAPPVEPAPPAEDATTEPVVDTPDGADRDDEVEVVETPAIDEVDETEETGTTVDPRIEHAPAPGTAEPVASRDYPKTLSEALGRGELDEIDTVPELTTRIDGPAPSGLPQRVPGAQRPGTSPALARGERGDADGDAAAPPSGGGSATGALGFLSGFSSATPPSSEPPASTHHSDDSTEPTEEDR